MKLLYSFPQRCASVVMLRVTGVLLWMCLASAQHTPLQINEGGICKQEGGKQWTCTKPELCPSAKEVWQRRVKLEICSYEGRVPIICCEPEEKIPPTRSKYELSGICKQEGGKQWTCTKPELCPTAKEAWQRGVKPEICSYQGRVPIICCEPEEKTPPIRSKSELMCEKYAENIIIKLGDEFTMQELDTCPVETVPLIANGQDAIPKEFPHMALVGRGERNKVSWHCGGTLISERFVLSAAHCTHTNSGPVRWVRLGEFDTQTTQDNDDGRAFAVDYEIAEYIDHPNYINTSLYNDIALYRLKEDVELNQYVRPACLQTMHYFPNGYATATGWGKIGAIERPSPILQKANLNLVPSKECSDFYQSAVGPKLRDGIKDDLQLCAGDINGGQDTCSGDSGGPLQLKLEKPYCMFSVIGVVSFGPRYCGDDIRPSVYTRVSHYVPWIESIVWP